MFVLKIIREILKISHLFMTRKASSGLCGHIAPLSTANDERRLLYTFCADKKDLGVCFLLPYLIDWHACLVFINTQHKGEKHMLLTWDSQGGWTAGQEPRKIYFPCKLTVQLFLCCVGGKGHPWKVLLASDNPSWRKHEAKSVWERKCLQRGDEVGEW